MFTQPHFRFHKCRFCMLYIKSNNIKILHLSPCQTNLSTLVAKLVKTQSSRHKALGDNRNNRQSSERKGLQGLSSPTPFLYKLLKETTTKQIQKSAILPFSIKSGISIPFRCDLNTQKSFTQISHSQPPKIIHRCFIHHPKVEHTFYPPQSPLQSREDLRQLH